MSDEQAKGAVSDHGLLYDRVRELEARVVELEAKPKPWPLQSLLASAKDWPEGLFFVLVVLMISLAAVPIGITALIVHSK